jgi:hypothetical protein
MKFRLFGGLDCPDTVLAQLSVVANLPTALLTRMVDHVTTVMLLFSKQHDGGSVAPGQATELEVQNEIFFASADIKDLDRMEVAQALTSLHTIVANIIRFNVPGDAAINELSMLGLAAEAAEVISAGCSGFSSQLRQALVEAMPVVAAATQPQATVVARTHVALGEGGELVDGDEGKRLAVQLVMQINGRSVTLSLTPDKCRALLSELIVARQIIKEQNVLHRE